jgi:hypothetical protein
MISSNEDLFIYKQTKTGIFHDCSLILSKTIVEQKKTIETAPRPCLFFFPFLAAFSHLDFLTPDFHPCLPIDLCLLPKLDVSNTCLRRRLDLWICVWCKTPGVPLCL